MLIKYSDPFEEFKLISDNIWNDFFKSVTISDLGKGFPVYDQYNDEKGNVVLEFPLAGYKPVELSIVVEGNKLTISGKKNETTYHKEQRKIARRSFTKTLTAHDDLNLEKIEALFEDGLLQIKIPSKQSATPTIKEIEIQTSKVFNK